MKEKKRYALLFLEPTFNKDSVHKTSHTSRPPPTSFCCTRQKSSQPPLYFHTPPLAQFPPQTGLSAFPWKAGLDQLNPALSNSLEREAAFGVKKILVHLQLW